MPITQSAKKALRQSERRRERNAKIKKAIKAAVKEVRRLAKAKRAEDAAKLLPRAYQALDKAAKKGVIKKNTAGRLKSRLSQLISKSTKTSS
jgi:small subunit ribosomal protein S20